MKKAELEAIIDSAVYRALSARIARLDLSIDELAGLAEVRKDPGLLTTMTFNSAKHILHIRQRYDEMASTLTEICKRIEGIYHEIELVHYIVSGGTLSNRPERPFEAQSQQLAAARQQRMQEEKKHENSQD